jgi:hypothetical protein
MKKSRPGVTLSVMCRSTDVDAIQAILFSETTTLGVRRWAVDRRTLRRQPHRVETPWGAVEGKIGWMADGVPRFAPEFDSCGKVASQNGVALRAVYEAAQKAFDPASVKPQ